MFHDSIAADSLGVLTWDLSRSTGVSVSEGGPWPGRLLVIRETKEVECVRATQLGSLPRDKVAERKGLEDQEGGGGCVSKKKKKKNLDS